MLPFSRKAIIVALGLLLAACGSAPTPTATQAPPTAVPATPTQSGFSNSDGDVAFFDDFSDPGSGWTSYPELDYPPSYESGHLVFSIVPTESFGLGYLPRVFEDVAVSVDVKFDQPAHDGDIGILCRYVDSENYYSVEVTENGYYAVWKKVNSEYSWLIEWTPSSLIPTDGSPFILNAACDGTQLQVGINDQLLGTANDADLASGYVGLIAGTYENGGLIVSFDNFEVIEY